MIIDSLQYNGPCSCGRSHAMQTRFSLVEAGCLKQTEAYLEKYELGGFRVAVYDENTYRATADRHPRADLEVVLNPENLHANEHGVELLMEKLPQNAALLLAVGSGTVHDLVRYCAYLKKIPFVSCPTAASVDGFCSSVAAMTWNGCKKTLTAVAPTLVLADLDIIKKAPLRLARSGVGDMIGKYVALTDWRIGHILTGEFLCERIAKMTLDATEAVAQAAGGILEGEETAYAHLMYGLLLSGLAMQMMGNSRPASGAEHHISHIIEMEPVGLGVRSDALHGEKVGVGTLLAIGEYRRLASSGWENLSDYRGFPEEQLEKVFGEAMTREILEENRTDVARGITAGQIKAAWESVCREIGKLPELEMLQALYRELGMKAKLSDIGVADEKAEVLLRYSPAVRNRLTFMRLCKGMA